MADEGLWVPIALFASISVIFCIWFYFRYKARAATQETFRLALEKGQELTPDLIKQMGEPEPPKDRDLRRGLIWLALGIALVIMGFAVDDPDAFGPMIGSAAFPGLIGVAYLAMWRFGTRRE
jgi:Na+/H+ antiporter NhaD/arsenite permease-like protein